MRISVLVKPNARSEGVQQQDETHFIVSVRVPPAEGKANNEVVRLLAGYFSVPKSRISIKRGITSRNKLIDIV